MAGDGQVTFGDTVVSRARERSAGYSMIKSWPASLVPLPIRSLCSLGSRRSWSNIAAIWSVLLWNWPRTGEPTGSCVNSRQCSSCWTRTRPFCCPAMAILSSQTTESSRLGLVGPMRCQRPKHWLDTPILMPARLRSTQWGSQRPFAFIRMPVSRSKACSRVTALFYDGIFDPR